MRILFLTRSFNGLAQRLYLELSAAGHTVAIELDIADAVTLEAAELFDPQLVIAPFLQRAIPQALWQRHVCLVVHPGIAGDRGPSALDWAIDRGLPAWGVTVLQAEAQMDAGPVWASVGFAMREATKSSLYRREVTEAAVQAVLAAVQRFEVGLAPTPAGAGHWQPLMQQQDRLIDWRRDDTATVLRKIQAADGMPGVEDRLFGRPCRLFDAHAEPCAAPGPIHEPGMLIARRDEAVLRVTTDGAVWIGHARRLDIERGFKLPVSLAFADEFAALPDWPLALDDPGPGWRDVRCERHGGVLALHFPFYNGALSTARCERLTAALRHALARPERVLLLMGGGDFWCNGIHLHAIEAAASPADESWRNITAMNELTRTLIAATDRLVIAALQGNAGAGGVFMALAADQVWARRGAVLNPHYKNMGNLYGSEYWTYLLPRRPLRCTPAQVMGRRLPLAAPEAAALGLIDEAFGDGVPGFAAQALARAQALAARPDLDDLLHAKRERRRADEARKPLAAYADEELARMRRNFYGFDPSYHVARSNFVYRVPHSWTPRHLAIHRAGKAESGARSAVDQDQDKA
ncbi:Hydrogenase maturation factor HoxX [Rubrivivax sp. A210]|uniref:hydrogenase maturation protein n=1 Tax=Rubrivivax sp. A210 TaxID=2772301 RepID=UPI00191AED8B|nr:hydrogenase maturation protein [Rubrivivax sp. A210]CAD5375032.1 Hydrogenase maturation factor HoxX [Rubrivivax sp. A210]